MTSTRRVLDAKMPSKGGIENSPNEVAPSSMLRPSAPVFVPATLVANTFSVPDESQQGHRESGNTRNFRSGRKARNQTKKPKSQHKKRGQRRQEQNELPCDQDSTLRTGDNNEHNIDSAKKTKKGRPRNTNPSRRSQKYSRKGRQKKQNSMAGSKPKSNTLSNGKSCSSCTSNEDVDEFHCHDNHDDHISVSNTELELSSSLAFPALVEDPSPHSRSQLQSTLWNNSNEIRALREGQGQHNHAPDALLRTETEEKWQNGLDRLTSSDRKNLAGYRRREFQAWDESEEQQGNEEEGKQSSSIKDRTMTSESEVSPAENEIVASERRTFDITRLRDRWWAAVAEQQRRLEEQQAEEQKKEQTKSTNDICCDYSGDSIQINYGAYDTEQCSIDSVRSDSHGNEMNTSALVEQKVNHIVPLYKGVASKLKLLDLIIEQNDDQSLKDMIESAWNFENDHESHYNHAVTGHYDGNLLRSDSIDKSGANLVEHAITMLIHRNHPNLLRTVLSITRGKVPITSKPLIQAARLGHEECASILLSKQEKGSTMLFLDDADGNTALHYCCRENGNKDMLRTLLKEVAGTTKRKRQQLSKLITARNKKLQTPLHVACEAGRNDLVEVFLSTCKSSVLFRVMALEDIRQETPLLCSVSNDSYDVVLSLLMWRRNHDHQQQEQSQMYSTTDGIYAKTRSTDQTSLSNRAKKTACPLVWAAQSGNLEMIDLLIQFGEQSGTSYQVTNALLALLRSDIPGEIKLKGSNSLILAGGNPFQEVPDHESSAGGKETSISAASKNSSDVVIRSTMSTALQVVSKRQLARRRDPILQHQPEAFFKTLESKENFEAKRAISKALIETLFRTYSHRKESDFSKAIALYENVGRLGEDYLVQLQSSLRSEKMTSSVNQSKSWSFLAAYWHSTNVAAKRGSEPSSAHYDRSVFAEKSLSLLKLPGVQNEVAKARCLCPWMRSNAKKRYVSSDTGPNDALILTANDGSRFPVHVSIVSEKSGKIASAIRFARMKCEEGSLEDESINLDLDVAPDFCSIMIQHMYHGSICFGWPNLENSEMCRYLLELMIVAEEFLIPSLVQEIEMRLMSPTPFKCFCWDCCQALRSIPSHDGKMEAQCMISINGSSLLVNKDTAMDVLSLTDYIGGLDYSIFSAPIALELWVQPQKMWAHYDREFVEQKSWKRNKPLAFLRNIAILTILKEFDHVVNRPEFYLTTEGDHRKNSQQKEILLQVCLDELRSESGITLAYNRSYDELSNTNEKD